MNTLFSLGLYRSDKLAAKTLMAVLTVCTVLWGLGSFFLVVVNI
jgi:hypothetical protein